jgi:hypothetical protein
MTSLFWRSLINSERIYPDMRLCSWLRLPVFVRVRYVTRPQSLSLAMPGFKIKTLVALGLVSGDHENEDITTMTHDRIASEYAQASCCALVTALTF